MKKKLFAGLFALGISLFINASQTFAQSEAFRVSVPFDFSANNKTLPAGTYTVHPATDNRVMWRVQSVIQKPFAILMVKHLTGSADAGNVALRFRRYGDRYFLAGFNTVSFQIELPTSSEEKNLRPMLKLAKTDVVIEATKTSTQDDEK
jgi:hypothetical protein